MTLLDNIGLVIILYNPQKEDINNIRDLSKLYKGVIVDNSSYASFSDYAVNQMIYVPLYKNIGIAEAQNIGIFNLLKDELIEYIVFLDQDSRIGNRYPELIQNEFVTLRKKKGNLAILGPTLVNMTNGLEYGSVIHKDKKGKSGFVHRREIISSGSVTSRDILEKVGLNDSSLFIDFVDFEWCWRANSKGLICGVTDKVKINHKVGKRELYLGGYIILISAPGRYFYQYRNYIFLCGRSYVPLQWKIAIGIKFLARLLYFPILINGGFECWKNMIQGIVAAFGKNNTSR